jgi:hypothetical protein
LLSLKADLYVGTSNGNFVRSADIGEIDSFVDLKPFLVRYEPSIEKIGPKNVNDI